MDLSSKACNVNAGSDDDDVDTWLVRISSVISGTLQTLKAHLQAEIRTTREESIKTALVRD